jgi:hypothetical protein
MGRTKNDGGVRVRADPTAARQPRRPSRGASPAGVPGHPRQPPADCPRATPTRLGVKSALTGRCVNGQALVFVADEVEATRTRSGALPESGEDELRERALLVFG